MKVRDVLFGHHTVLLVAVLTVGMVEPVYADQPYESIECDMKSIQATFKATSSNYHVDAICWMIIGGGQPLRGYVRWNSQGSYDPHTRVAKETVHLSTTPTYIPPAGGGAPFSAAATTTLSCASDPWLGPSLGAGKALCSHEDFQVSGQVAEANHWLHWLKNGFLYGDTGKLGFSLPNSTGFQYNRASLIAQRDGDLQAEAAAVLQRQNKRLTQAKQPVARFAPTILLPTANTLFMQNNVVPIKLLPPQGIQVTGFLVKLERRDANGNWGVVTNLPIGIEEATSSTGYTGWGAPGNGRDPARMVSLSGSYRISAQVAAPHQTAWSPPVPFAVTSPKRAIQKAPKMFGQ